MTGAGGAGTGAGAAEKFAGDPGADGSAGVADGKVTLGEAAAPEITAGGVYGAAKRWDGTGKSDGVLRPKLRNTSFADSEINTSL